MARSHRRVYDTPDSRELRPTTYVDAGIEVSIIDMPIGTLERGTMSQTLRTANMASMRCSPRIDQLGKYSIPVSLISGELGNLSMYPVSKFPIHFLSHVSFGWPESS